MESSDHGEWYRTYQGEARLLGTNTTEGVDLGGGVVRRCGLSELGSLLKETADIGGPFGLLPEFSRRTVQRDRRYRQSL